MKAHRLIKPLIHPAMHLDENPVTYLKRIAELNKYSYFRWLVQNNQNSCSLQSYKSFYQVLASEKWTGVNIDTPLIKSIMATSPNKMVPKKLKQCPLCIKKYGYYKINWQFLVAIACTEHGVLLQDKCQSCDRVFDTNTKMTDKCSCGADILDAKVEKVSAEVSVMQSFIDNKNDIKIKLLNTNSYLEHDEYLDLLHFFSNGLKVKHVLGSGVSNHLKEIQTARDTMMDVAEALFAGEAGFRGYLSKLLKSGKDGNDEVRFRLFYQAFYKKFPQECLSEYRKILEQFLNENWVKPLTRRNINFSEETINAHPWIPLQQACREFDISKSLLRRSIDKHLVRSKKLVKEKRVITLIYKPDLMARIDRLKDYITAKEARAILGLTRSQFSHLCEVHAFRLAVDPKDENCQSWKFSRNEIRLYRDKLIAGVKMVEGEYWSFAQLLQYFGGQLDAPLKTLLEAVESKDLKVAAVNKASAGLASMLFTKAMFLEWYKRFKEDGSLLSIPSLAKVLGINQEFTYQLVNNGVIEATSTTGSDIKWISKKNLLDFTNNYILSSKLSKKIQMNPRKLVNLLASREVHPIDYEWDKKLRQKVYKKEILMNVDFLCDSL